MRVQSVVTAALALIFILIYSYLAVHHLTSYRITMLKGDSMEPRFYTGDIVLLKEGEEISEGDIISFRTVNGPIFHRVIHDLSKEFGYYVTKGDNNEGVDVYDPRPSQVLGKYEAGLKVNPKHYF